jgi:acyl-[acyl carrier protein]--UDP-N-acetylglucosamine O-acyltransferase
VWFQCVIRADVNRIRIGHHTNIQDGTVIHVNRTDPVEIGDHVTLGHAVRLHGAIEVHQRLAALGLAVEPHLDVQPIQAADADHVHRTPASALEARLPGAHNLSSATWKSGLATA